MRFLDVKTDYAFKRVFGSDSSKPLLMSFLNAILEYEGAHAIVDLEIVDPYQIPKLAGMKDTYVDVKAKLANGKHVIIEMQVVNVQSFEQRILFNAAKHYANQLQKGQDYSLLNPVIALSFVDFVLFEEIEHYQSRFQLIEKETLVKYSDDVELVFIELPKFTKSLAQLKTIQDKWIYFLKNAGKLDAIPDVLHEPCIEDAFDKVNEADMSEEELELQWKRHDFIWLQKSARKKALEEGFEQGKAEGVQQAQLEIAKKLLDVMSDEKIVGLTGLSPKQVAELR